MGAESSQDVLAHLSFILSPADKDEVTRFYLVWILTFVLGHFLWDWRSTKTPPFSVERLKERSFPTIYNAANFATSLLLLIALWQNQVMRLIGDTVLPLIIAGFSGVLQAIIGFAPPRRPDNDQ